MFDPIKFILNSWVELIYLLICLGLFIPMMNLVLYHLDIVRIIHPFRSSYE